MNKSQRIYFNTGNTATDKYVNINLEQDVDTLELLSMSISTKDVYQNFNADYGVLVGRVIANDGVGVPNAKISIFIPLTDDDELNANIKSVYPYKTPRDKNKDGKRYNLLPRVGRLNPTTGIIKPAQPFGSFPIKEELVTNQDFLDVYKKYYKYTALTNSDGDYMMFGVPIGTQVIHMSVDITDIGPYSMTPAAMITNLGYSPNLFVGNTRIKPQNDLNDLPHLDTQEITVDVIPFWGDVDNFEIGITRQDFKIRAKLTTTFVVFGSVFTDGSDSVWTEQYDETPDIMLKELNHLKGAYKDADGTERDNNLSMRSKRYGNLNEKIYYIPSTISDDKIASGNFQPSDMKVLSPGEYSVYKNKGDFVFIISCNRGKVATGPNGGQINVDDDSGGVYTQFRGFITFDVDGISMPDSHQIGMGSDTDQGVTQAFRYRLKVPQGTKDDPILGKSFTWDDNDPNTKEWKRQHTLFSGGSIYSVAKFHGTVHNKESKFTPGYINGFYLNDDIVNQPLYENPDWNVGVIKTNGTDLIPVGTANGDEQIFGAEWLNFSLHLIQAGELIEHNASIGQARSTTNFSKSNGYDSHNLGYDQQHFYADNQQEIAAGVKNTKWLARSDIHMTDFVLVKESDINAINQSNLHAFTSDQIPGLMLNNYRKTTTGGDNAYFYLGQGSNCVKYLYDLGIV